MFDIKQRFGLVYENRMYVVERKYHEGRGAMQHLPLQAAGYADFIVDLTGRQVLKLRAPDEPVLDVNSIRYMFFHLPAISLNELYSKEPRLQNSREYETYE